jgi:uncharacterized RDD family membrane protein YckC
VVTEPHGFLPPAGAHPAAAVPGRHPVDALPAAPWGRRAGALLVDYVAIPIVLALLTGIVVALLVGDAVAFTDTTEEDDGFVTTDYEWWLVASMIAGSAWYLLGSWLVLGLWKGRSVGRRLTGIRVVRNDGTPVGVGTAFLREAIVKTVLSFLWLPLLLSYLWPLWDTHQRALHDMMSSTRVVDDRADAVAAATHTAFGTVHEPTSTLPPPPPGPLWAPPHPDSPGSTAPREAADAPRRDDDELAKRIGLDG